MPRRDGSLNMTITPAGNRVAGYSNERDRPARYSNRQNPCREGKPVTEFRVGVMDPIVAARPTADALTRAQYLEAVANRVDSFWVPDHLNQLFPRSLWKQQYCG